VIKFAFMINRIPGTSREDFEAHYRKHGGLMASIPEAAQFIQRYTVSVPVAAPGFPDPAYDGLTELWFENWDDHASFYASDNYKQIVQPDEPTFIDPATVGVMVTKETIVV
jgi:hypothetical protein